MSKDDPVPPHVRQAIEKTMRPYQRVVNYTDILDRIHASMLILKQMGLVCVFAADGVKGSNVFMSSAPKDRTAEMLRKALRGIEDVKQVASH